MKEDPISWAYVVHHSGRDWQALVGRRTEHQRHGRANEQGRAYGTLGGAHAERAGRGVELLGALFWGPCDLLQRCGSPSDKRGEGYTLSRHRLLGVVLWHAACFVADNQLPI